MMEGELMLFAVIQAGRMVAALQVYGMIACFFLGTVVMDWTFYWIGRKRGRDFIARSPKWQKRFQRMERLFAKRGELLLFSYRFMYGCRLVLPVLFGVANVHPARFAVCSLCSTIIWISVFSIVGLFFADWARESAQQMIWIVLAILLTILGTLIYRWRKLRDKAPASETTDY
mgnify:CR=1 FL=1